MILYIRALGFSEYDTKDKAEILVAGIIKDPTDKAEWEDDAEHRNVQYYQEFGDGFGLMIRGILNEEDELSVHSLLPYSVGKYPTDIHEVDVVKQSEQEIYHAFCEELGSGTPISFFLQNLLEYKKAEKAKNVYINDIRLSAFCVEGTVILPIDKDDTDLLLEEEEERIRQELLDQARKGDEEAMAILDDEAIEASEVLQERLRNEDILSVLEGFFVPVGDNDDIYSFLGNIEEIEEMINDHTGEKIFQLKIQCMNIAIDVFVNEADLVGYPSKGMRYKGTCWIHGIVDFVFNSKNKKNEED